jgi:hypothetical protein
LRSSLQQLTAGVEQIDVMYQCVFLLSIAQKYGLELHRSTKSNYDVFVDYNVVLKSKALAKSVCGGKTDDYLCVSLAWKFRKSRNSIDEADECHNNY